VGESRSRRGQVGDGRRDLRRGTESPGRRERGQVSLRFPHAPRALGADRARGQRRSRGCPAARTPLITPWSAVPARPWSSRRAPLRRAVRRASTSPIVSSTATRFRGARVPNHARHGSRPDSPAQTSASPSSRPLTAGQPTRRTSRIHEDRSGRPTATGPVRTGPASSKTSPGEGAASQGQRGMTRPRRRLHAVCRPLYVGTTGNARRPCSCRRHALFQAGQVRKGAGATSRAGATEPGARTGGPRPPPGTRRPAARP
jgi:hypothetical protein